MSATPTSHGTAGSSNTVLSNRLKRELQQLSTDPPPGVTAYPVDDDIMHWHAQLTGPDSSVFENGSFDLDVRIPDRYPFTPPSVRFATPVYHPNIDEAGRICLDLLKAGWKPSLNLATLLTSIRLLLVSPNCDDALVAEIAKEYVSNKDAYEKNARKWTAMHAVKHVTKAPSATRQPASAETIEPPKEKKPRLVGKS
eukprot:ANDGO_05398.mRNA.1 hypothetical protein